MPGHGKGSYGEGRGSQWNQRDAREQYGKDRHGPRSCGHPSTWVCRGPLSCGWRSNPNQQQYCQRCGAAWDYTKRKKQDNRANRYDGKYKKGYESYKQGSGKGGQWSKPRKSGSASQKTSTAGWQHQGPQPKNQNRFQALAEAEDGNTPGEAEQDQPSRDTAKQELANLRKTRKQAKVLVKTAKEDEDTKVFVEQYLQGLDKREEELLQQLRPNAPPTQRFQQLAKASGRRTAC